MIDQSNINLLSIIPIEMKRSGSTGGGEYHGPCPFCGGKDRFIVQPNSGNGGHWWCRQCGKSGDPIAFIMQYDNLDFKAAVEKLGATLSDPPRRKQPQPETLVNDLRQDYTCFTDAWQQCAADFVDECTAELWDHWKTSPAARWLRERGINEETAIAENIGVNPATRWATWGETDVWLPRGITIPWQIDRQFWNVRIRRPNADLTPEGGDKYISVKGCANGLYNADGIRPSQTILMTEGEFDALVVNRYLRERQVRTVEAVSIGSCTGARVTRWIVLLSLCKRVLVAFDNDPAGEQAAGYWQAALYPKAARLRPQKKDITEDWQAGLLAGLLEGIQ